VLSGQVDGEPPHEFVGRLARFELSADGGDPVAAVGPVQVLASDEIDADGVRRRIEARRDELRGEVERGERKLANAGFVEKAPPEVVEEEREKLAAYRAELEELER
jgi:valyl-tRNA synthetase